MVQHVDSDGQKHIWGSRNDLGLKAAAKNCQWAWRADTEWMSV